MRNIVLTMVSFMIIATSCSKTESDRSLANPIRKTTDPVIEKYAEMGTIVKAEESFQASLPYCNPPLGIYLFTPKSGPFAGEICEIYRYTTEKEINGPCGDEFIFKYEENTLNGEKFIDCPNDGTNCYTFQGPASCVIVYCDENEVK